METTRADLTNKLSALENKVGGTVQAATNAVETTKDAVTDTVESVKETVEDVTEKLQDTVSGVTESVQGAVEGVKESVEETFKSVAETLNLRLQCERHPWLVFGGAVAAGCIGGWLLGGSSRSSGSETQTASKAAPPEPTQHTEESGGFGSWLWQQLNPLKGLAVGAAMSVVRDLATQALPENFKEKVTEEVNKLTETLGGKPFEGSLLPANQEEEQTQENVKEFHDDAGSMSRSAGATSARSGKPALATSRR